MNDEAVKKLFATEAMQDLLAQMLGLEDASLLSVYFDRLDEANMMIVYGSNMESNLNVQVTQATLTMELLTAMKEMLDTVTKQQYLTMGVAEEDIHPMEIQEIGGRSWYGMQLVMIGMNVQSMLTIENGMQYTLTFTEVESDVLQHVLESFNVEATAAE